MREVEFFFGLGSRYLNLCGASPFQGAPLSGQYEWDYRRRDAVAWAEYYRVPFVEPKPLPEDRRLMARACHAAGMQGGLRPYCEAKFQAVFISNEDIATFFVGDRMFWGKRSSRAGALPRPARPSLSPETPFCCTA